MEENQSPVPSPNLMVACDIPIPGIPSAAECMFKKLMAHIADFERVLNPDQEVGASRAPAKVLVFTIIKDMERWPSG